jgi:ABC-type uncharacterized transport system substrate-binding protein
MSGKIFVWLLTALLLATALAAEAQQPKRVPRIGFLLAPSRSAVSQSVDAFRQGLRDLGYLEGQNILIEYRFAEGRLDRLPDFAAELVRLKVDVIVAGGGGQAIKPAKDATSTIPIVMTGSVDPLESGLVASLARPGGNITGLSLGGNELSGKRLELLKETVPRIFRVALFWNPRSLSADLRRKDIEVTAIALQLKMQSFEVSTRDDFDGAFQAALKERATAFTVTPDPVFTSNRQRILSFAAKNHLSAIYPWKEYVEDGGLMSYAPKLADNYRRAATYVDKILKGTKPAELPVEQPTTFELVINLRAAKQIDLTIPQRVLLKADKVIK